MLRTSLALLVATVACSSVCASVIPVAQLGRVETWSDSTVAALASSTELAPLDLQVGHTFNEAELRVGYAPQSAPGHGLDGQIYVSSVSLPGEGERRSSVVFNYRFQVSSPADYFLLYDKQGEADTTFLVQNEFGALISLTETSNRRLEGRFAPGDYSFAIEAAAFSSFAESGTVVQDYSQLNFVLFLTPVPEPTGMLAVVGVCLPLGRRPRRRLSDCRRR